MTRAAAQKWAQERERWLILHGHEQGEKKPEPPRMPTLAEFCPRFIEEYVVANRLKPSTIQNKKMIVRNYLVPVLGTRALDKITEVGRAAAEGGVRPPGVLERQQHAHPAVDRSEDGDGVGGDRDRCRRSSS
jgi:hypothetical protein